MIGQRAWFVQRGEGADRIYPVDQARDAQYALRQYVEIRSPLGQPHSSAQRLTMEHANLLQATRLPPRIEIRGGACRGRPTG